MKSGVLNDWTSHVPVEKEFLTQKIMMDDDSSIKDELLRYIIEHYMTAKDAKETIDDFYSSSRVNFFPIKKMVENGCVLLDLTTDNHGSTLFYCADYPNVKAQEDYENLTDVEMVDFQTKAINVFCIYEYEYMQKFFNTEKELYAQEFESYSGENLIEVFLTSEKTLELSTDLEGIVYEYK